MIRINVTEDNKKLLQFVKEHVHAHGFEVISSKDGLQFELIPGEQFDWTHCRHHSAKQMTVYESVDRISHYIPVGVHQCCNDDSLTLLQVSDSFLTIFGYTREEILEQFQDSFLQMIHLADRTMVLNKLQEQLRLDDNIELEYRICCKNGDIVWVLAKGRLSDRGKQTESFYCILLDITTQKHEQEALRLSLERHKVILDQATDIIFEWDICQDTLLFSQNWRKKFGYDPIDEQVSSRILLSQNVHPEDSRTMGHIIQSIRKGTPYAEAEVRIKDVTERYLWCRIRASVQFDAEQQPIKVIGVILDIDTEKKQNQALLEQAQKDALTGLYNKATINSLVEQRMNQPILIGIQALMIIDVDNFKGINDNYGHLCGDTVLSDVASVLKKSVRTSDLVGRIGGDEFLVYLPEITDAESARHKAKQILDDLGRIIPCDGAPAITCSIGLVIVPRASLDYLSLYLCADQALYYQKDHGRCGVTVYDSALCGMVRQSQEESAVGAIGSDLETVDDGSLAQYSFRMLYETDDIPAAMNRLLEIIGRSYDVSRAYIFESSEDGERGSITFEWCCAEVSPQMDALQNLSYRDDMGDYLSNFNEDGIFFCPDIDATTPDLHEILTPQGIYSMLQCAILDDGQLVGGVGFDECRKHRQWSTGQIASFKLVANVLGSFLVKHRIKQRLLEQNTSS